MVLDDVKEAAIKEEAPGMKWWTALRLMLGWSFVWGFLDKFFGLGFSTCRLDGGAIDFMCDSAMANGGSPTYGFLNFATEGSHLGGLFDWMAPAAADSINFADVFFMAALFFGGIALMTGIAVKWAAYGGAALMFFMFLAADVWPVNNPINSSHVIEFFAFMGVATVGAGSFSLQSKFNKMFPKAPDFMKE